jgi:methylisocitrate lyase
LLVYNIILEGEIWNNEVLMSESSSAGMRLRAAMAAEKPLQIVGVINAYAARLAEHAGFRAIYLSGGGVAAASLGVPDLGITTLEDILIDARRITDRTDLPLLVDVDTGFGSAFNVARTVRSLIKAGAAALHIEDQVQAKRCGHRPGKDLVSKAEMVDRIKAAVDARKDPAFGIMARTDALAVEGLPAALDRAAAYVEAGADMLFAEAVTDLSMYAEFARVARVPILANMTEFGRTPLATADTLGQASVDMVLYPLSAFRAMSAAALRMYQTIRQEGTQERLLPEMQTRVELYDILDYFAYEQKLDELFAKEKQE